MSDENDQTMEAPTEAPTEAPMDVPTDVVQESNYSSVDPGGGGSDDNLRNLGVAIAVFIFNKLSRDIDEWQEIKNGNIGVALIEVALIVMIGIIVFRVI